MNKKLLTLAVGAALAVSAGAASADFSWYGKANMALASGDIRGTDTREFEMVDDDADPTTPDVVSEDPTDTKGLDLVGSGSRLGINASEDLGNGLTVAYWHEWSINTSDGRNPGDNTGNFGHRDNVLSLSGDFGTAFLANAASPYKALSAGKFDFFADNVGDANVAGFLVQPAGPAIGYSNNMGDIGFAVVHSPSSPGTVTPDDAGNIGNVTYNSGPLFIGGAMGSFEDNAGPAETAWILGGIYSMDIMTFMAAYQSLSGEGHTDDDSTAWTVGAKFGIGEDNTVLAQYSSYDSDSDATGTLLALGFEHAMSKNLTVGVHYATQNLDDGTTDEDFSGWDAGASFKF